MSKRLPFFLAAFAAFAASAASTLMPASIDFNKPTLWGKEVLFGFDDNGRYTGTSRWYLDGADASAFVQKYDDANAGCLQATYESNVHRTIMPLKASESAGPSFENGQAVPRGGIYMDSIVTLFAYTDQAVPRIFDKEKDKINCWISVPAELERPVTNFIITAGSELGTPKNFVTDAHVVPGEAFRLTIKAIPVETGGLEFEVWVNGEQVTGEGVARFPSMLPADSPYASKLYSFGVAGVALIDKINFTKTDPREDPEYDLDDVSALRERADITVSGYPAEADGLVDFPVLVRISEETIRGFHYDRAGSGGSDIRFTDENGKLIPCEIDTWNPAGESLVWVKVPYFAKGAKITMHWSLATGKTAPGNNPAEVWSDYIAVWHMTDAGDAHQAKDSSGHGFTARMLEGGLLKAAENSVIGAAGAATGGSLLSADYEAVTSLGGNFTFTGWYLAKDVATWGSASKALFGKKIGGDRAAESIGWCGLGWAKEELRFYGDGNENYLSKKPVPDMKTRWIHAGLVYSGDAFSTMFANGEQAMGRAMTITSAPTNFMLMAEGVWADEVRIARKARSADWIRAEYEQAIGDGYLEYGAANAKDTDNYWVVEPYVKPNSASVEEAASMQVYAGQPRYGTSVVSYFDAAGVQLVEKPTAPGSYKAVFTVSKGVRDGLEKVIPFIIYEERAYHNISGHDRVMLFNSDTVSECPVSLQGYHDVDVHTNRVWSHSSEPWEGFEGFVLPGVMHVYYEPDSGRKLWEFRHARIGNLFPDRKGLSPNRHYLPWSATSRRFDDSEKPLGDQADAGTLILQNVSAVFDPEDPAAAYSPVYENGIGSVYFDAVNAYAGYVNRLKLQITDVTDEGEMSNPDIWKDVPVEVFAITDGVFDESMSTSGVTEIALRMNRPEGSVNSFYRIRALIDTNAAVRVRIIRTDDQWNGGEDDDGLISIDNIIISNPAMGVRISQFGAPADPDNLVLRGQRAPFDVAFPTAADLGRMHAQVKVDYIINNTNAIDTSFVGALSFKYRWRYLDQTVGEWTELLLDPDPADPTRFVSADPIEGLGLGDIEYNASAVVNAPFYDYWDYSGLVGWRWPDRFTERRGNVWISAEADGVYSKENLSPALGTDYFVRLREGASDWEGFRLHVRRTNGGPEDRGVTEEIVDMSLVLDGTWRGFYQTITNGATNVYYYVEGYNRQTATGCDYQRNTVLYHGTDQNDVPANDVLSEGLVWARLPCDELTGYLMFQLEDATRSISVIHADYQNFNNWTDARLETGEFLGTSTAVPTSGVSRTAKNYAADFSPFRDSVSSNKLWVEQFNLTGLEVVSTDGYWAVDRPFDSMNSPNGWAVQNGTWVCEQFRVLGGKSMALQLEADYGVLTMNRQKSLRGVERLSYDARIAQSYGTSRTFNYYVGTTNDVYHMQAYTFAVPCVMETQSDIGGETTSFTGVGTVSAVARYRDSKGGYEVRAERVAEKSVQLSLYKWHEDGTCEVLGVSPQFYGYSGNGGCSLDGLRSNFGALFISCTNTTTSVRITAGLMASGQFVDDALQLSGKNYFKISYEDTAADRFTEGTFGVGSKDCPATFAFPKFSRQAVAWSTSGSTQPDKNSTFRYWQKAQGVTFLQEQSLLATAEDYDEWNIYVERLPKKNYAEELPYFIYGFRASLTPQKILVETTTTDAGDNWRVVATNVVSSFGFTTFENALYLPENSFVRFRPLKGSGGPEIVVDNFNLTQWRGEDYDSADAGTDLPSSQIPYGAPSNFVFTTAWISHDAQSNTVIEISPMRTTVDNYSTHRPAGVRSPLFDGLSGRGLGLGAFSFAYRDADRRARLLVQVCTNGVGTTSLPTRTKEFENWVTVATYDFSEMTEDDLASGLITTYVGLHGVTGVMRVIVDPELVIEANDPTLNPDRDPTYGRIFIVQAAAKDNPRLDSGSWWGWNLRTTDDPTKQLLKDGDRDVRLNGLAYALNDSIENDIRIGDVYDLHKPFLQTPILTHGAIGEVTFKARKYSASDHAPSVAVYGMRSYDPAAKDEAFEFITNIVVDCERYETFIFRSPNSENYTAIRLAVTGVDGIIGDGSTYSPDDPPEGPQPDSGRVARVLIDEVAVFEAIKARLGFCRIGAFRTGLSHLEPIPDMPDREQQPLVDEEWGIQTELYAVRLSEQIDYSRQPKVTFHWFVGDYPWGYDNWKDRTDAGHAQLLHAEGSNLVYRSGYADPTTIVPAVQKPSVVQYSLEVVYYMQGQQSPITNVLTAADWVKPPWYRGVDLNASHASYNSFAAYTILDTVPYGYAWINEINVYDGTGIYNNLARTNQYVEIAVPREADLTGWQLRFITGGMSETAPFYTNVVARFGSGLRNVIPSKNYNLGGASNYVFITVGNPYSCTEKTKADGTIDGYWSLNKSEPYGATQIDEYGVISAGFPIGIELVRPTGVIEYQVVTAGTNSYADIEYYRDAYSATNFVNRLNAVSADADWRFSGEDMGWVQGNGVSVTQQFALVDSDWTYLKKTPGRINIGEYIDPIHPIANGSSVVITADIGTPNIWHRTSETTNTTESFMFVLPKGDKNGTNIFYTVERWYEIDAVSVTSDGKTTDYLVGAGGDGQPVMLTLGQNCSNHLYVTAKARISTKLREQYGLNEQNAYTPAVLEWLKHGTTEHMGEFQNDDGEIRLAKLLNLQGEVRRDLELTEMYWLDIDPTASNMFLTADVAAEPRPIDPPTGYEDRTNTQVCIYMAISNATSGDAWAPYTLRGLEPFSSSAENTANWTSVTFKVVAYLNNGKDADKTVKWLPLRYFTFCSGSFGPDFTTTIDVWDPRKPPSPGYYQGWDRFPDAQIYYRGDLDGRLAPIGVDYLKPTNPVNKQD